MKSLKTILGKEGLIFADLNNAKVFVEGVLSVKNVSDVLKYIEIKRQRALRNKQAALRKDNLLLNNNIIDNKNSFIYEEYTYGLKKANKVVRYATWWPAATVAYWYTNILAKKYYLIRRWYGKPKRAKSRRPYRMKRYYMRKHNPDYDDGGLTVERVQAPTKTLFGETQVKRVRKKKDIEEVLIDGTFFQGLKYSFDVKLPVLELFVKHLDRKRNNILLPVKNTGRRSIGTYSFISGLIQKLKLCKFEFSLYDFIYYNVGFTRKTDVSMIANTVVVGIPLYRVKYIAIYIEIYGKVFCFPRRTFMKDPKSELFSFFNIFIFNVVRRAFLNSHKALEELNVSTFMQMSEECYEEVYEWASGFLVQYGISYLLDEYNHRLEYKYLTYVVEFLKLRLFAIIRNFMYLISFNFVSSVGIIRYLDINLNVLSIGVGISKVVLSSINERVKNIGGLVHSCCRKLLDLLSLITLSKNEICYELYLMCYYIWNVTLVTQKDSYIENENEYFDEDPGDYFEYSSLTIAVGYALYNLPKGYFRKRRKKTKNQQKIIRLFENKVIYLDRVLRRYKRLNVYRRYLRYQFCNLLGRTKNIRRKRNRWLRAIFFCTPCPRYAKSVSPVALSDVEEFTFVDDIKGLFLMSSVSSLNAMFLCAVLQDKLDILEYSLLNKVTGYYSKQLNRRLTIKTLGLLSCVKRIKKIDKKYFKGRNIFVKYLKHFVKPVKGLGEIRVVSRKYSKHIKRRVLALNFSNVYVRYMLIYWHWFFVGSPIKRIRRRHKRARQFMFYCFNKLSSAFIVKEPDVRLYGNLINFNNKQLVKYYSIFDSNQLDCSITLKQFEFIDKMTLFGYKFVVLCFYKKLVALLVLALFQRVVVDKSLNFYKQGKNYLGLSIKNLKFLYFLTFCTKSVVASDTSAEFGVFIFVKQKHSVLINKLFIKLYLRGDELQTNLYKLGAINKKISRGSPGLRRLSLPCSLSREVNRSFWRYTPRRRFNAGRRLLGKILRTEVRIVYQGLYYERTFGLLVRFILHASSKMRSVLKRRVYRKRRRFSYYSKVMVKKRLRYNIKKIKKFLKQSL